MSNEDEIYDDYFDWLDNHIAKTDTEADHG